MTHNFTSPSLHPSSPVKFTILKTASPLCTPDAAASNNLSIPTNLKSESVLFGLRQRSHAFSDFTLGSVLPLADHVQLLGVTLDKRLSMDKHRTEVSRACFYNLRALRLTRPAFRRSFGTPKFNKSSSDRLVLRFTA